MPPYWSTSIMPQIYQEQRKLEAIMQLMAYISATIVYSECKIRNQYKRREKTENIYKS